MEKDTDQNIVFSFFRQHPLMTLTTVTTDGIPQNAAVYVYMDDDFNCYFATRSTTRKFNNVTDNPVVTLATHDENVIMFGELLGDAQLLENKEEVAALLPQLQKIIEARKSVYWVPPVAQLEGDDYVFFKITPKEVTFANYELSSADNPKPKLINLSF